MLAGLLDICVFSLRMQGRIPEIFDFNGTGRWSQEAILDRYQAYVLMFDVPCPRILMAREGTIGSRKWIFPLMQSVIEGIKARDAACIELGVEFIETDEFFSFGRTLKSNTARALRQTTLSEIQIHRVRRRVFAMLIAGMVPHEYHEYAKLLRKNGVGSQWHKIKDQVDQSKWWTKRYYDYFEKHAPVDS